MLGGITALGNLTGTPNMLLVRRVVHRRLALLHFFEGLLTTVVALVLANSAEKRIRESNGRLTGLDQARAARIIAIIELVLTAVLILIFVIAVALSLGPN